MDAARRRLFGLAGAAVAAPLVARVAWGQPPQVVLKLHHSLSAVSNGHVKFLQPWAKKLESESGGRIRVDIFPSMQLGGSPAQLFDQVRGGMVDIVWTRPGNTPGRFPIIEVFELPFVCSGRAAINAKAVQSFAELNLKQEFREVHPICFGAHDRGLIHAKRPIATLEELRGVKLRPPTRLAGETLRALGANVIGMPIAQIPEALVQRVIDGCVTPWQIVPTLKIQELVKFHTDIPSSPTLCSATFVFAMNAEKYQSLPNDLKQIIDAHSGQAVAVKAAQLWDEEAVAVSETAKARGDTIATLTNEEVAPWRKAAEPVIAAWLKQMKDRGLDGGKLLANARALLAKYEHG